MKTKFLILINLIFLCVLIYHTEGTSLKKMLLEKTQDQSSNKKTLDQSSEGKIGILAEIEVGKIKMEERLEIDK